MMPPQGRQGIKVRFGDDLRLLAEPEISNQLHGTRRTHCLRAGAPTILWAKCLLEFSHGITRGGGVRG